ncbi:hypothetical protein C1H46_033605 [Malus baccata]|uniref:Uncharacterized protein n=1 Tax=Malus baccata TaxID=106549 RepID=A0A540L2Y3_MALBA|nr:hypothetical protein C1H46_033605 [Malus baccata]
MTDVVVLATRAARICMMWRRACAGAAEADCDFVGYRKPRTTLLFCFSLSLIVGAVSMSRLSESAHQLVWRGIRGRVTFTRRGRWSV